MMDNRKKARDCSIDVLCVCVCVCVCVFERGNEFTLRVRYIVDML